MTRTDFNLHSTSHITPTANLWKFHPRDTVNDFHKSSTSAQISGEAFHTFLIKNFLCSVLFRQIYGSTISVR